MADKRIHLLLIFLVLSSLGCSESSIVGKDLFGEEDFQVSYNDTLTVAMSTIRFDSIRTSNTTRMLIGQASSSHVGKINAETYFLVTESTTLAESLEEDDSFDSLTLILPLDDYIYQRSVLSRQTLIVEQLPSVLEYNDGQLYNTSQVVSPSVALTELATKSCYIDKEKEQTFEMKLSDAFGEELFESYKQEGNLFDASRFKKFVKGFRLRLDSTVESKSIIGLKSDSIRLKLYYTDYDEIPATQKTAAFYVNSSPHFIQIHNEHIPLALADIETLKDEVSSTKTANQGIVAGGLGYATKVEFPGLQNLLLDGPDYLIVSAELKLVPTIPDELKNEELLPSRLLVNIYDKSSGVQLNEEDIYAGLVYDDEYGRDTYYFMDISELVHATLIPFSNNHYTLRFTLPADEYNSSITTIGLGDQAMGSSLTIYTITNK